MKEAKRQRGKGKEGKRERGKEGKKQRGKDAKRQRGKETKRQEEGDLYQDLLFFQFHNDCSEQSQNKIKCMKKVIPLLGYNVDYCNIPTSTS